MTFGIVKKAIYSPCSDFGIKFIAEVICSNPHSSGFIVEVTSERDSQLSCRYVQN